MKLAGREENRIYAYGQKGIKVLKLDRIDLDVLIDILTDDEMRLREKYKEVREYLECLSRSEAEIK